MLLMQRKFLVIIVLIFLGVTGTVIGVVSLKNTAAPTSSETAAQIVDVGVLNSREGIEISGNIEPVDSADLAFPSAGYIEQIFVSEGDEVEAGQTLALLEDSQQRYNLAQVDMEIDTEIITGTRRNMDLLELKREMTVSSLDDTRLNSTISGIVTKVNAGEGDYVTAQQAGSAKDVVVRVIDRSAMVATVEVDELDVPYLKKDLDVVFQFDAYPDLEIRGRVSDIPLEARTTTQGIAVLDTEVRIDSPPDEILPSLTFAGEIVLDGEETILTIPESALIQRRNRSFVLKVVAEGSVEKPAVPAEKPVPAGAEGVPQNGDGGMAAGNGTPGAGLAALVPNLPEGLAVQPVSVTVAEYGSGMYRVLDGLAAGDQVAVPVSVDASASEVEAESGTSVMQLLGMPTPGAGGGGRR